MHGEGGIQDEIHSLVFTFEQSLILGNGVLSYGIL